MTLGKNTTAPSLFEKEVATTRPLADRLRPHIVSDVIGQDHLVGPQGSLRVMAEGGHLSSLILWGPPGCGKTTLARLLAQASGSYFVQLSAIMTGVADLRRVFDEARMRHSTGQRTVLFVDEIHRFNKSQQDAFLPFMEDGTIILIGATTENPSFELNAALLSRATVFVLNRLDTASLAQMLVRAEQSLGHPLPLQQDARDRLIDLADGDGRYLLGMVEQVLAQTPEAPLTVDALTKILQKRRPLYDKNEDGHYNLISALHKSVRGSDPDAALYWFCRMLEGGEDPHFLARRMVRMAAEDIGLASPQALNVCIAAWQTYDRLGSPEGELALAEALVYLATAPKSNAVYVAYKAARKAARDTGSLMPPKHILNAPTQLMRDQGYSDGYQYDHDAEGGFSGQNYFPDGMKRPQFYVPTGRGFEQDLKNRLSEWAKKRAGT